jgi:hypothetical protein
LRILLLLLLLLKLLLLLFLLLLLLLLRLLLMLLLLQMLLLLHVAIADVRIRPLLELPGLVLRRLRRLRHYSASRRARAPGGHLGAQFRV